MKQWIISSPRSGNTMVRWLMETFTRRPTDGLIGERNPRDVLQEPLIYKGHYNYCLHKEHSFKPVKPEDFVLFVVRDPLECCIRHNEKPRGISKKQMQSYLDDWFGLLEDYDNHKGAKLLFYYDAVLPLASKDSRNIYPNPQSDSATFHQAKLGRVLVEELERYIDDNYKYLKTKYRL